MTWIKYRVHYVSLMNFTDPFYGRPSVVLKRFFTQLIVSVPVALNLKKRTRYVVHIELSSNHALNQGNP